ncbi:hypothetical protein RDI58_000790 [Solanum bulbocastanum]|uniref:Uncharacterized protein n=1 Tax=Solanum bulbocastanum TaxID=147425 RepID=A0AAN8UBK9_SOLBU
MEFKSQQNNTKIDESRTKTKQYSAKINIGVRRLGLSQNRGKKGDRRWLVAAKIRAGYGF